MKKIRWFLVLLCIALTTVCMFVFPDKVILHYDLKGNMDWKGPKYFCFIFPIIVILISLLMDYIIKKDKKKTIKNETDKEKQEIKNNTDILEKVALVIVIFFYMLWVLILFLIWKQSATLSIGNIDFFGISTVMISFLIIFLGDLTTKVKMNSVLGIRTRWSMYNDQTWKRSNLFGGILLIIVGIISIIFAIIIGGWISELIMFLLIILAAICSCVVSYKEFRKEKNKY